MTVTTNLITGIGVIVVPVSDQERALAFYVEIGIEKRTDVVFGPESERWIEVARECATGYLEIEALYAELADRGVDLDPQVSRMGGPRSPSSATRTATRSSPSSLRGREAYDAA